VCARSADDDRQDVASRQHEELVSAELHLGAAVLAVQHPVAHGDVERHAVAVVVDAAGADGDDFALLGLLLGGVGDDEASTCLMTMRSSSGLMETDTVYLFFP
jgi:hypothetical protein